MSPLIIQSSSLGFFMAASLQIQIQKILFRNTALQVLQGQMNKKMLLKEFNYRN
jgi:hypothetical protein